MAKERKEVSKEKAKELGLQITDIIGRKLTKEGIAFTEKEKLAQINKLIDEGADVNVSSDLSVTALQVAARLGYTTIASSLIRHGANVNGIVEHSKFTPLHEATSRGHSEIVTLLLKHRADINVIDDYGHTPLHIAAISGHSTSGHFVELFLQHGADPTIKGNYMTAGDWFGDNKATKAKCKALEEIYSKIKAICKKLLRYIPFTNEDNALLDSLKKPEETLRKNIFKGLVKAQMGKSIISDKTDEMEKLAQFLERNNGLMDREYPHT